MLRPIRKVEKTQKSIFCKFAKFACNVADAQTIIICTIVGFHPPITGIGKCEAYHIPPHLSSLRTLCCLFRVDVTKGNK